jgi:NTF2 fold immunity protein of polymorphic toxin system component
MQLVLIRMTHVYLISTLVLCGALLHFGLGLRQAEVQRVPRYLPPAGAVPDATTAVRIAEAVLGPFCGEETVKKEKPFTATLRGDIWTVEGTLPKEFKCGGVGLVQISKKQGCILTMLHGK